MRSGGGTGRKMAEREGFEPSVTVSHYGGLANRWIKPLSHLSRWRRMRGKPPMRRNIPDSTFFEGSATTGRGRMMSIWRRRCPLNRSVDSILIK
jgi:hypothetical protein